MQGRPERRRVTVAAAHEPDLFGLICGQMTMWFKKILKHLVSDLWSLDLLWVHPCAPAAEETAASSEFSLILPIHDAPDVAARCIESLERYAGHAEVIVVDDGSKLPATTRLIDSAVLRNGWQLVRHAPARRHSRACEAGAQHATRPYLCFLNSDCVWTRSVWQPVLRAFDDPSVGMVGPALSNARCQRASSRSAWCAREWSNRQVYAFAERHLRRASGPETLEMPQINGSALFIRRRLWEALGGFHPALPDYGNETELCHRVVAAGWRILWTRRAYVHHLGCASFSRIMTAEEIEQRHLRARKLIDSLYGPASPQTLPPWLRLPPPISP